MVAGLTLRTIRWAALAVVWSTVLVRDIAAADRIIDQQPYDLLSLKQDAKTFKIVPMEMERRLPLREKDRGEWLVVQLLKRPEQRYHVRWRDIERVQLFEELVLEEAVRLTDKGDFDAAHEYYGFIERRSPGFPGLAVARHRSLFREAEHALGQGLYVNALVLLNELYERDQHFPGLKEFSGRVVDRLVEEHLSNGRHTAARELLDSLAAKYSNNDVVETRRQQLMDLGEQMYSSARAAADAGRLPEAHELTRAARDIWPDSINVRQLAAELSQEYPVIRVGVRESWNGRQGDMPAQWTEHRCRSLIDCYLFFPQSFDTEGGKYESRIVSSTTDGRQTTLTINAGVHWPGKDRPVSSFDVGRQLATRLEARELAACSPLAAAVESTRVVDATSLEIVWRFQCPRWRTMLRIPINRGADVSFRSENQARLGAYRAMNDKDGTLRFTLREGAFGTTSRQPREISETVYRDTLSALRALRAREIQVYDRIVPWDVSKARAYEDLQLVRYAAPTVHLLVPNPNSRAMASGMIRRALSLALDRRLILRDVLGDGQTAAGAALSGPFPEGYGCDASIKPRQRDARGAAGLLNGPFATLVDRTITLVHAPDPVARRAVRAIQTQCKLDGLGLDVVLVESSDVDLASGPSQPWDLWYIEWNAMEPLVDAQLLFGLGSIAGRGDPLLQSPIKALQRAATWDEVRAELHEIHRRVDQTLPVIPLWQLDEYAVVHRSLHGVGTRPVTLYQNVDQWQVKLE